MCGDIARFEAVLKPDSSCWSITWQKRTGKVIEIIDTSTEKYSGSTNRKLVIQSVCKEDEGEYQVLLSQSNGNGYFKCEHTLCLHVLGGILFVQIKAFINQTKDTYQIYSKIYINFRVANFK